MKKAKSLLGRMCVALKFGPTSGVVLRQMLTGMVMQLVLATAGLGAAQAQTVTYFHNDAAGTPQLATNAAGAVVWKEHYLPYGHRQVGDAASTDNKLGYAGKAYEPQTQLSYMGARYYMPVLGRFTGIDPVEMVPEQPHSLNRYAYANNNPYKYVDPDGKAAETVWDAFNIALGFQSLVSNLRAGNWSGAALDGVGVALDGVAAAIPVVPGGAGAAIKAYRAADAVKEGEALTSRAARREAMRDAGIPTSQQPVSQSRNASGREYSYDVPAPGGGIQPMSVQPQTMDRSHPGQAHWEAGRVKTDPRTGAVRENNYGRPALTNDKSKVDY